MNNNSENLRKTKKPKGGGLGRLFADEKDRQERDGVVFTENLLGQGLGYSLDGAQSVMDVVRAAQSRQNLVVVTSHGNQFEVHEVPVTRRG